MQPPISVDLEAISNCRDLGGYAGRDGRLVRTGVVFRSAALAAASANDLATLARLGLRTVCDFRGVEERGRAPTTLTGPEIVGLPIEPSVGAGLRDILATKEATGEALFAVLQRAYEAYAINSTAQYGGLFARILKGGTPLLFHCAAGKDRTGFGAALILTAVGVAWDDVLADFEATNRLWRRDTVPASDLPPAVREQLLRAEPSLLEAAFAAAKAKHGSLDKYFERALGLDHAARVRLEAMLLA